MRSIRRTIIKELDKLQRDQRIKLPLNILEEVVFRTLRFKNNDNVLVEVKSIALSNEHLRKLDLSELDFTDVDIMAFNLSGTNANIDPQKVYNKDLLYTNLNGHDMSKYDFTDVDIRFANLKNTGARIDLNSIRNGSIEGTKLDDDAIITITNNDIKKITKANKKM